MSSFSPQIIPLRAGANLAPLDPLMRLQESPGKTHYVCDAIKERFTEYIKREDATRRELIAAGEMVGHFMQGDQIIEPNPYAGGSPWIVLRPQRRDGTV